MSHGRRGVSLVEFIVAVGLLAMVFVFMFQLLPYSHVVSHEAWNLAFARDLAHSEMETARSYQVDYLYAAPTTAPPVMDPRTRIQYTWTMAQTPYQVTPCGKPNLVLVTVNVAWTETGFTAAGVTGTPKRITTQTLIARTLPPRGTGP
ncbi:MAG TPA: hypothetical protein VGO93_19135 [Candidatus Xenobia bacterium]